MPGTRSQLRDSSQSGVSAADGLLPLCRRLGFGATAPESLPGAGWADVGVSSTPLHPVLRAESWRTPAWPLSSPSALMALSSGDSEPGVTHLAVHSSEAVSKGGTWLGPGSHCHLCDRAGGPRCVFLLTRARSLKLTSWVYGLHGESVCSAVSRPHRGV